MSDTIRTTMQPLTVAQEGAMNQQLTQVLVAPPLPPHFRARLLAGAAQTRMDTVSVRKQVLEQEYGAARARMRSGQVRLQRDTALRILAGVFTAGVCVYHALPWLQMLWGVERTIAMPVLSAVIGLVAGASVWAERFGQPVAAFE